MAAIMGVRGGCGITIAGYEHSFLDYKALENRYFEAYNESYVDEKRVKRIK